MISHGDKDYFFQNFPPYDIVWERAFAVYEECKEFFHLIEWEYIYKALTRLHQDGLNVSLDHPSPLTHGCAPPVEQRESDGVYFSETQSTRASPTTEGIMWREKKMLLDLLQANNFSVNERVVSERIAYAQKQSHKQLKYMFDQKEEELVESKLHAFGDFSTILNEAQKILQGKIGDDELVGVLTDLIAHSRPSDGGLFWGAREAKKFTTAVVASLEILLNEQIGKFSAGQVKGSKKECFALLNLLDKTIYLSIRTGQHFHKTSRKLIHLFCKKVWSLMDNPCFEEIFTNNYPFLIYKLIIWDNLDTHYPMFTPKQLSSLYRQFKQSLHVIVMLSKTPLFECLEVVAMVTHRSKLVPGQDDELSFIKRLCVKMLVAGMHSEPMDEDTFAYLMLEYQSNSTAPEHNPFANGPMSFALQADIGEFLCLNQPQEILDCLWHGELHTVLVERRQLQHYTTSELWNSRCLFLNAFKMSTHRKCPCLISLLDFLVWVTFLACTYTTIISQASMQSGFGVSFSIYHYILFTITAGFAIKEIQKLSREELHHHFTSFWNIQDMLIIFTVVAFAICKGNPQIPNAYAYQALAIVSLFVLFRTLSFARILESYGMLVTALFIMMADAIKFLVLFLIIMVGFAVVMFCIVPDAEHFSSVSTSFLYVFEAGMTNFDFGWVQGSANETLGIIVFTIYIIISAIVLLNMLIAILAETYSEMSNFRKQKSAVSRAHFIQEYQAAHNDLPTPLNCITAMFSLVGLVLTGQTKKNWESATQILYHFFDYLITAVCVAPAACILDCLYISRAVGFLAFKKIRHCIDSVAAEKSINVLNEESTLKMEASKSFAILLYVLYYIAYLISFLVVFITTYSGRFSYNLFTVHSDEQAEINNGNIDEEFSFRTNFPIGQHQNNLYCFKQAMLRYFHSEQSDGTDDLINELDFKMGDLASRIHEDKAQSSESLQQLEERLFSKLSGPFQSLEQRINRIEQVNSKILARLTDKVLRSADSTGKVSQPTNQRACLDLNLKWPFNP